VSTTLLDSIIGGAHDSDLDAIVGAIRDRQKILAARTVAAIKPGDTVRFSNEIRPRYLVGKTATVVKVNRQSVVVNCPADPAYGRFEGARNVRCPNALIEGLA
jgi:hypothetical protein